MSGAPMPTEDDLAALIKPLWLAAKPSREAQLIRSSLSVAFDDARFQQWASDFTPEYTWALVDIAAQHGIAAGVKAERNRILAMLRSAEIQTLCANAALSKINHDGVSFDIWRPSIDTALARLADHLSKEGGE